MTPGVTVFPYTFLPNVPGQGEWFEWDLADGPITLSFTNGAGIQSIWFPNLPGVVTLYNGSSDSDPVIYETGGSGDEMVPMPNDIPVVTLSCAVSSGTIYVFISTVSYSPVKESVDIPVVTEVEGNAPILIAGSASVPVVELETPLAVGYGGTGQTDPSLIAGPGIIVSGAWPNQTITATANGTVTSVTATAPLASSGGTTPNISIQVPLPVAYGGTGTTSPGDSAGPGIEITGTWPNETITNTGVVSLQGEGGAITLLGSGGINITTPGGSEIQIDASDLVETITSTGDTVTISRTGQTVDLEIAEAYAIAAYTPAGTTVTGLKIVQGEVSCSISSGTGSATVSLTGNAQFTSSTSYAVIACVNENSLGEAFSVGAPTKTATQFTLDATQITGSPVSGTIKVGFIAIGT
jgi:hypothetical protein